MKKQLAVILLCVVLLVFGWFCILPLTQGMLTAAFDYANQKNFASGYDSFELCNKHIDGNYFYYTAWCSSQPDNKPMYMMWVYKGNQVIAGDITTGHIREGEDIKAYRVKSQTIEQYVVFGHNPDKKYSSYTLDLLDNNQVAKEYVVDIADKEHILDVYDCDKIYIPRLTFE